MKNNTMYILGGVAVVGLAFYLYNQNKKSSITITAPAFSNATGTTTTTLDPTKTATAGCGGCGANLRYARVIVYNSQYGTYNEQVVCIPCVQSGVK